MDEWMDYLKTGVVKEGTRTPGLQQVREKLRILSMTKAEREAYYRHLDNIMVQNDSYDTAWSEGREDGLAAGRAEGLAEGRAEGRTEEKHEIARKMLAGGMSIDMIASFTGLSVSEIITI